MPGEQKPPTVACQNYIRVTAAIMTEPRLGVTTLSRLKFEKSWPHYVYRWTQRCTRGASVFFGCDKLAASNERENRLQSKFESGMQPAFEENFQIQSGSFMWRTAKNDYVEGVLFTRNVQISKILGLIPFNIDFMKILLTSSENFPQWWPQLQIIIGLTYFMLLCRTKEQKSYQWNFPVGRTSQSLRKYELINSTYT